MSAAIPSEQQREQIWKYVVELCSGLTDHNDRAVIVQQAICKFGPVPNSMGNLVRAALSPNAQAEPSAGKNLSES